MYIRSSAVGIWLTAAALMAACNSTRAEAPKPDGGKFTLLLQGKPIGTDTFRLLPDGCDSDVQFSMGGQEVQFHQNVKYKKGQLVQIATNAGALGTMTLALAGEKSSLKVGDKPATTQKLPIAAYPYGDRSPHLLAFLVSGYDTKKGGEQKFDLLFSEGAGPKGAVVLTASLKEPETSVKQVGGKPLSVLRYPLTINSTVGPTAMEIVTDKEKHILFWSVPAQKYSAVREGFQDLGK